MKKRHIHGEDVLVSRKSNRLRRKNEKWKKAFAFAVTAWTLGMATAVCAHPELGAAGAGVTITGTADMTITSTATDNLIKWVDFSIGSGEKVAFDANNYLNYVTGHAVSDIQGTLTGGGNIYLVNPNGILIGDNAVVNVGNLHLSTKPLDTDALTSYDAGVTALSSAIIGNGDVINMGRLNADTIIVEGNNITFKNTADVTKGGSLGADGKITGGVAHTEANSVSLTAGAESEIHLGFAVGEEATSVNNTQYTKDTSSGAIKDFNGNSITLSDPTGWSFNGGAKTPVQYMLIRNAFELQNINNNLSGNYMLAGDINMGTFGSFTPIGKSNDSFKGRFDGLNHQIQNLTINLPSTNYVGLFGQINGVVENVGLVGGSVTGSSYVGGIAGENFGTIRNVYNTGSVTGTSYVGGIVGLMENGTIINVYNTGSVTATGKDSDDAYVGGVVGQNKGTVECAYNTGDVTGKNSDVGGIAGNNTATISKAFNAGTVSSESFRVGGIVGFMNFGTIINAYNTGDVTGHHKVGGIVGTMEGNVTNVYNTGSVTATGKDSGGDAYVGGLVGYKSKGILTNAYTKSGMVSAPVGAGHVDYRIGNRDRLFDLSLNPSYAGVTIDNEDGLKKAETFEGFDFTESGPWRIYKGKTTPFLAAFPIPEPADPTNPVTPDPVNPDPVNPDPVNPDPVNPDPVNPDPTNPGTTDPTNPGTTDPTNPGMTDPTNPGTTDPTNPGTTDPTNPTNPTNPVNPTPPVNPNPATPTTSVNPQPEPKLQDSIEKITDNPDAAKEYTNVLVSLESGKPTANLPTEQEQNGLLPAQQTGNGQPAGNAQTNHLELAYNDINVPKSMSIEALATMLNGKTTATLPNNAGGEAQPTATQGALQEGGEEEA